jgi:hypothetical protein
MARSAGSDTAALSHVSVESIWRITMDQDPIIAEDLEPVRLRTSLLEQIDRLSEDRRRLLQEMSTLRNQIAARRQLSEIDRELDRLWDERRRELRQRQRPEEEEDYAIDLAFEDMIESDATGF